MNQFDEEQQIKVARFCENRPEIIVAYLFGSRARGNSGPLSDIDLAFLVEFSLINERDYPYGYQTDLMADLMSLLKTNDLDAIVLNDASPLLKFQVIYHGEVVFSRSEEKKLAFHVKAFNEYQDIRPMLAVQHEYMLKRLAKSVKVEGHNGC
jgi:predicted nucleotidyltransferase